MRGSQALVITEDIIDRGRYHYSSQTSVTWETSEIRQYLNSTFLNTFNEADRRRITNTIVINNNNPWFDTYGGNNTVDRIFLLSIEEVVRYFGDSGQFANRPDSAWAISDEYSLARIALDPAGGSMLIWDDVDEDKAPWVWWLRSPGRSSISSYAAAFVDEGGDINVVGHFATNTWVGIRPALWLDLQP